MSDSTLDSELACGQCGYDLRGLPSTGDCPECGTPIRQTLAGEALEWASRPWQRRVRLGCLLVLAGQACLAAGFLAHLAHGGDVLLVFAPSAIAICAAGAWLIASPGPRTDVSSHDRFCRRALRVAAPAPVVAFALPVAPLPVMLFWALAVFCTFTHLQRIAARGRVDGLTTMSGFARWALPSAMLLLTAVVAAMVRLGEPHPSPVTFCGLVLVAPLFIGGYGTALAVLARFVLTSTAPSGPR